MVSKLSIKVGILSFGLSFALCAWADSPVQNKIKVVCSDGSRIVKVLAYNTPESDASVDVSERGTTLHHIKATGHLSLRGEGRLFPVDQDGRIQLYRDRNNGRLVIDVVTPQGNDRFRMYCSSVEVEDA